MCVCVFFGTEEYFHNSFNHLYRLGLCLSSVLHCKSLCGGQMEWLCTLRIIQNWVKKFPGVSAKPQKMHKRGVKLLAKDFCINWACVLYLASYCLMLAAIKHYFMLGQAKLIIRVLFLPACFFANATKFSLYGSLHRMDLQMFHYNHYFNNEVFLHCFLKILVIMNNEKWLPAHILFWKPWNRNLIIKSS